MPSQFVAGLFWLVVSVSLLAVARISVKNRVSPEN